MAMAENRRSPSLTALKIAVRSAQFVGYVCKARRPDCLNCGIREWCRHYTEATRKEK